MDEDELIRQDEIPLQYAIEEAFAGDFTSLKELVGLDNNDLVILKKLQGAYFLQFEGVVKAHIAMMEAKRPK